VKESFTIQKNTKGHVMTNIGLFLTQRASENLLTLYGAFVLYHFVNNK